MLRKALVVLAILLLMAGPAVGLIGLAAIEAPDLAAAAGGCTPGTISGPLRADAPVPAQARVWVAEAAATCTDLPEAWLAAVMDQESGFDPTAHADDVNGGTWGLFQLDESTWSAVYGGGVDTDRDGDGVWDILQPDIHARYAATYLCRLLAQVRQIRQEHPDWAATRQLTELQDLVIAHNAGPGRLQSYPDIPTVTADYLADVDAKATAWADTNPDRPVAETSTVVMPVPAGSYHISSGFGWRTNPITGAQEMHPGTDFAAPAGTPILAIADGVVEAAGPTLGLGNWIVVRHTVDGATWTSVSGHMEASGILVRVGQQVTAGQQIGAVGSAGLSTGDHLHLEIHAGDSTAVATATDPAAWLAAHGAQGLPGPAGTAPQCPTPTSGP